MNVVGDSADFVIASKMSRKGPSRQVFLAPGCQHHQNTTAKMTFCAREWTRKAVPPRTSKLIFVSIFLQFLLTFAQGQGQGGNEAAIPSVGSSVSFQIEENLPANSVVGTIPTQDAFRYKFSEEPPLFSLDPETGVITTKVVIDRESLKSDTFHLFVLSVPSPKHIVEVRIKILDKNDNSPMFEQRSTLVTFSENNQVGTEKILETATDRDIGLFSVTTNYTIISGNEEGLFELAVISDTSKPLLYLKNREQLNREEKGFYQLNISAQDGGTPPRYGFLQVNITVEDVNDEPPLFDQSDYSTTVNETIPISTSVIKVHATDNDIGANADISYFITEQGERIQFQINKEGIITTSQKLICDDSCASRPGSNCKPNSCVLTVEARDGGPDTLTGRAYITVTLLDENDHSPEISIRYTPPGATYATVDEGAKVNDRVAIVSVADRDEGVNAITSMSIIKGNERGHFKLRQLPYITIVQVAGELDRERVSKYNLTLEAKDQGVPQRSSTAFLIIMVNDINDHKPVFLQPHGYRAEFSELVPVGSFVASVTATDNDTDINAKISYSIVSGDTRGWFKINNATGLVTTKAVLDHERRSIVILSIKAQDGAADPKQSYTNLTIIISDENDEIPTFTQEQYTVTVAEGTKAGTVLLTVDARDDDQGLNGSVTYSFGQDVEKDYKGMFQIDATEGKLKILKELDREENGYYILQVHAQDQGTPAQSSDTTVYVNVTDVNDNAPVFYPVTYYAQVQENQPAATYILQVSATDLDAGLNGQIFYDFLDRDGGPFGIDLRTGWIGTLQQLDREQKSHYTLKVSAYDSAGSGLRAAQSAIVEITVTDIQDSPPEFAQPQGYMFTIIEDDGRMSASLGRLVGQVGASTKDTLGAITYAISGGDQEGIFTISENTGSISTFKALDRENMAAFSIKVVARSGNGMFAETFANITVLDINDNAPSFGQESVVAYVVENWPVGHDVYLASAVDPDDGDNARVAYSLLPTSAPMFRINPTTGMIYLGQSISQTTTKSLTVTVEAKDSASAALSAQLKVTIQVRDINDHTPRFEQSSYEVSVSESRPVNDRFYRVIAEDKDDGLNGEVVYSIVKGNIHERFGIFPDGIMYVAHTLDRENRDLYVLTVEAVDKGVEPRSSEVNVTINVLDTNDNRPVFGNSTYKLYLRENSPLETYVGSVTATDVDLGLNAEVSYKLLPDEARFTVHSTSGAIVTIQSFDREELLVKTGKDVISFIVIATDNGEKKQQDRAVVNVHVTDANDNAPIFSKDIYTPSLYENAEIYTQVVKVSATDADKGVNSKIKYTLIDGGDGKFSIDELSGQVILHEFLDRETVPYYVLTVMASDGGNPVMNATAQVQVDILDNNDNPPVFNEIKKIVDIIETSQIGTYITQVTASDADMANNAQITYQISAGNDGTIFHIDGQTGKLYLSGALDYENKQQYRLEITAIDFGNPRLSSTMECVVNVLDFNDNAPYFSTGPLIRQIQEGSQIGTSILTIRGNDPDSGINGDLQYAITQQRPSDNIFTIDPVTGLITTAAQMDREMSDSYELMIVATDQALPVSSRKTAEKMVTVIILDVNDNAPRFVSMNAVALMQTTSPGSLITTVQAVDPDDGNNGQVEYSITAGDTSLFRIDSQTGQLFLKSTLKSQVSLYELTLKAQDKGRFDQLGSKSSSYQLTVFTRTTSDDGPIFTQSRYSGQVYENEPSGKSIVTLSAGYSGSSSTNMEYYITSIVSQGVGQYRYFQIHPTSGVLSTADELDRETGGEDFTVEVYAVDTGSTTPKTRTTQVSTNIIHILEIYISNIISVRYLILTACFV